MRCAVRPLVLVLACGAAACVAPRPALPRLRPADLPAGRGAIAGVVTDSADGRAVDGAQVIVQLADSAEAEGAGAPPTWDGRRPAAAGILSDRRGGFATPALAPGRYRVLVRRIGYRTVVLRATVAAGAIGTLRVRLVASSVQLSPLAPPRAASAPPAI